MEVLMDNKKLPEEIIENKTKESDTLEFKKYYFENGKFNTLDKQENQIY